LPPSFSPRSAGQDIDSHNRSRRAVEFFYPVVIGTTFGMMLANIPAVLIGDRIADKLPVKAIRITAAVVFAALGAFTLAGVGR
jgi:putative Ca2+/H+ antiporter (TMEM165/GDT1 family)